MSYQGLDREPQEHHDNGLRYRDGFSTSLCDLFSDPGRKSDCCALVCCGFLASDRNRHLIMKKYDDVDNDYDHPTPMRKRILCLIMTLVALYLNVLLFVVVVIVLLCRASHNRQKLRQMIIQERVRTQSESGTAEGHQVTDYYSPSPHRCFPCCVPSDVEYSTSETNNHETNHSSSSTLPPDLCSCLWNICKVMCCGCISSWCQCFGICAIAQEDRELQLMLSKEELQIDYITFQPFDEYYGQILRLKEEKVQSFGQHFSSLSKLSIMIVSYGAYLLFCLSFFGLPVLFMILATLSQSIIVLFLVYWKWHRFDISLDAVIKYFAAGGLIGCFTAIVYEMFIMIINFLLLVFSFMIYFATNPDAMSSFDPQSDDIQEILKDNGKIIVIASFVEAFLTSFFVAAMVEELTKYFCFWMVEHPDFQNNSSVCQETEEEQQDDDNDLDALSEENGQKRRKREQEELCNDDSLSSQQQSVISRSSAITIAMISTAVGFAFVENLRYVFGDPSEGISSELLVLGLRSLLPLHPILAAIQSLGVIRRDIENDKSIGLGKIILPAFLIHGIYDFILMAVESWVSLEVIKNAPEGDPSAVEEYAKGFSGEHLLLMVLPQLVVFLIVIGSLCLFFYQRRVQRARLIALVDNNKEETKNPVFV